MLACSYLIARVYDSYGNRNELRNNSAIKFGQLTVEKRTNMCGQVCRGSSNGSGGGSVGIEMEEDGDLISLSGMRQLLVEWS